MPFFFSSVCSVYFNRFIGVRRPVSFRVGRTRQEKKNAKKKVLESLKIFLWPISFFLSFFLLLFLYILFDGYDTKFSSNCFSAPSGLGWAERNQPLWVGTGQSRFGKLNAIIKIKNIVLQILVRMMGQNRHTIIPNIFSLSFTPAAVPLFSS